MTEQSSASGKLRENLFASEMFATEAVSFSVVSANVISIALVSDRWNDETQAFEKVMVQRLVMPIAGAQGLALGLNSFLEQRGMSPSKAAVGDATPQ